MSRCLIATWDGAGNLVPTLALARHLGRSGYDVRLLGHRAMARRCGEHGWRFRPFTRAAEVDSSAAAEPGAEMTVRARDVWFSAAVAEDVRDELAREPADVLIADCMLFSALAAGEAARVATVSLFHGAFALFRGGPFADFLSLFLPQLNAVRAHFGLQPVGRTADVHDACALSLVAAPREFEPATAFPLNVRFAGPLLDGPPLLPPSGETVAAHGAGAPLVLVSLSTSDQGQLPVLQRLVAALSALPLRAVVTTGAAIDPSRLESHANVQIARFADHDRLLPIASLVITHAGLGTVMRSLAHGVPLLCLPFGRDQFFNASRVAAIGAGRTASRDAADGALRGAIQSALEDETLRSAAADFARVIAGYRGGFTVTEELAAVATHRTPTLRSELSRAAVECR
jgi:UDP:flavonoid glycosyltransferase YjiC (YdhE family)